MVSGLSLFFFFFPSGKEKKKKKNFKGLDKEKLSYTL